MKPIEFKEMNIIIAKDQPEYLPLPALIDLRGKVISCWKVTLKERIILLFTGKLFLSQLAFNQPLQPLRPSVTLKEALL